MASRPCMRHDHYGIGSCPQCEDEQAIADLERENAELRRKLERRTEALRHYADRATWCASIKRYGDDLEYVAAHAADPGTCLTYDGDGAEGWTVAQAALADEGGDGGE